MYLVLLIVGAGFVILSFVFGELFDFDGVGFVFLRPKVLALVLTVMGGVGLILTPHIGSTLALPISAACGLVAGFLLYRFIIMPLLKLQHTSAHYKQSVIGSEATVALSIPQNGFGKIKYVVNGSIVTSPAQSEDGAAIGIDTNVVIVAIKNNAYYVKERSGVEADSRPISEDTPITN